MNFTSTLIGKVCCFDTHAVPSPSLQSFILLSRHCAGHGVPVRAGEQHIAFVGVNGDTEVVLPRYAGDVEHYAIDHQERG